MQVSIETTSGLERRLTVGVPAERVDNEVNARLQKAAGNVRLPGFRPGKVPMKIIRQRFGAGVRQEVLGEVMSQSFYQAVQQEKLKPAGRPSIEPTRIEPGEDLEFVATFEVFPEIEAGDYGRVSVTRPQAEVTDADVERMIGIFRNQQGSWQAVERPAAKDDQLNIDYTGTRDGEPFEGGSATGSALVLGSERMIPGFEDGLVGAVAGEEKTLALSFPEDYHNEALRGAAVEFKVKVNRVEERVPAALDDDFFAAYGVSEGGEEAFRKEVRQNMERELANAIRNRVKNQVMDGLLEVHTELAVPSALVAEEINALRQQSLQQFGNVPDSLDLQQLLPDELFEERARRRVKLGLILSEIATREALKPEAAAVRTMVEELSATYEDPQEVVDWYYANPGQLQSVESLVLENQVVEHILARAQVSDSEATYEDVLSAASAG